MVMIKEHQSQFVLHFSFQNLSRLGCWCAIFTFNVPYELFHNEAVKQSIALESQDAFGWSQLMLL